MSLSTLILAAALVHGSATTDTSSASRVAPARTCVTTERTGTFRVTTHRQGRTDVGLGLIVLENIDGCLEATFITDGASPAAIDGLSMLDNTLKGAMRLPTGAAKVSLEFVGTNVEGSIVQGRNEWSVAGRKTS